MRLFSPAFDDHGTIPIQYTGDGWNHSPPLQWTGTPLGTREFALVCEDPDAPGKDPFTHWLLYGLSPQLTHLPERVPPGALIRSPVEALQGLNSFGDPGYGGPLPPVGHGMHRYVFRLLALSDPCRLPGGATRETFFRAVGGLVLEEARLTGQYARVEHMRVAGGGWRP